MNAVSGASRRGGVLCLGEALVDLICEREGVSLADAELFRPHLGGALANVAVACRRAGAEASLVGGVGDDEWGARMRAALEREGVGLSWFDLVADVPTAVAFVTFGDDGEPAFQVYGEGIERAMQAADADLEEAIATGTALAFGSNTMVTGSERALTLRARGLALDAGVPVLFDPNLRPTRWAEAADALRACREACEGAFCVRTNREEARLLTGEDDPAAAAEALCGLGARLAVVTLGPEGALMRGAVSAEAPGVEVDIVSTLGAGDAFMGTLAAGLAEAGWECARAGEALPAAVEAGAAACRIWGAWA